MRPIAISLDLLQGEKQMCMGMLLPTLKEIDSQFKRIKEAGLVYCKSLLKSLTEGVNIRFASQMTDPGLLLAAISHPCFKLDWLDNEEEKESAKSKLRTAVLAINNETVITSQENNDSAPPKHSFYIEVRHQLARMPLIENFCFTFLRPLYP